MYDGGRADKNLALIVRSIIGLALLIALLFMFVINPGEGDTYAKEYLWMAVHPFKIWDAIALIALFFVCLFLAGLLNKIIKPIYDWVSPNGENSVGMVRIVVAVCVALMFLFYV